MALVGVGETLVERWRRSGGRGGGWLGRGRAYVLGLALSAVVANLATAPFAAWHFNQVTHYGVLANMLAVPLAAFWVMPAGVLALLLMPLGLEGLALAPMGWGLGLLLELAGRVAAWPGAVGAVANLPGWFPGVIGLAGLWLFLWRRAWRWAALPVLLTAPWIALGTSEKPDALIAAAGGPAAIRLDEATANFTSLRRQRFTIEVWLRRYGFERTDLWARQAMPNERVACDSFGCTVRGRAGVLALNRTPAALPEDCGRADLLVSAMPVWRRCDRPQRIVTPADLRREGTHAIWLSGPVPRIETVAEQRGRRPWVTSNAAAPRWTAHRSGSRRRSGAETQERP